jgi:hypothetical protein
MTKENSGAGIKRFYAGGIMSESTEGYWCRVKDAEAAIAAAVKEAVVAEKHRWHEHVIDLQSRILDLEEAIRARGES